MFWLCLSTLFLEFSSLNVLLYEFFSENVMTRLTKLSEVLTAKHLQISETMAADSFWKSDQHFILSFPKYFLLFAEDRKKILSLVVAWEHSFWRDLPIWNKDWQKEAKGKGHFVLCAVLLFWRVQKFFYLLLFLLQAQLEFWLPFLPEHWFFFHV